MNIFVLDIHPRIAASYHNDKHCVKMIVETAQLLSTSIIFQQLPLTPITKTTHENHPCNVWARKNIDNFMWLSALGYSLSLEYTHRWGKTHQYHEWFKSLPKVFTICPTSFALAMPKEIDDRPETSPESAVESYRKYYTLCKRDIAFWSKRPNPNWWK